MTQQYLLIPERRAAYQAACGRGPSIADADRQGEIVVLLGEPGSGKSATLSAVCSPSTADIPRDACRLSAADFASRVKAATRPADRNTLVRELAVPDRLLFDDADAWLSHRIAAARLVEILDLRARANLDTVLTMASLPRRGDAVVPELRDRLRGGVVCSMSPLSKASRRRLLCLMSERHRISLDDEAASLAADSATQPGPLATIVAGVAATGRRHGGRVTRGLLAASLRRATATSESISIQDCESAVARQFGLSVSELRSTTRRAAVALPRQIAMHLARTVAGATYEAIGRHFGGRNHSTVMHACRAVDRRMSSDTLVAGQVDEVRLALADRGLAAAG